MSVARTTSCSSRATDLPLLLDSMKQCPSTTVDSDDPMTDDDNSESSTLRTSTVPPKTKRTVLCHQITLPSDDDTAVEAMEEEEDKEAVINPHPAFFGGSPVIGVFSQPRTNAETLETEYVIAASYVKWVESAGARILPIPWDASEEMATAMFGQINGILLTGGNSIVPVAARTLWRLANQANQQQGDCFPIWGTCLGFEWLLALASGADEYVLQGGYASHNVSWPVSLTEKKSELYSSNPLIQTIVTEQPVTMNNHEFGISPRHFHKFPGLVETFQITSVNHDVQGKPFVSTMESKNPAQFPYYGVQYHPEKNAFEYGTEPGTNTPFEQINHSADAVYFSFHLASFFVSLARKNLLLGNHSYTEFERFPLVYKYEVKSGVKFLQFYCIPPVGDVFVGKDVSWRLDDHLADHVGIYKTEYTDE